MSETDYNYSYMPVVFESAESMERVQEALAGKRISRRRYFSPTLNKFATRILCLPLHHDIPEEDMEYIHRILHRNANYGS